MAKQAKLFGAEAALLLITLPPAEAWLALTERASEGDVGAAEAAMVLALHCRNLPDHTGVMAANRTSFVDGMTSGLPQDWQLFLRDIDAEVQEHFEASAASCARVGGVSDFALLAMDRFMRGDDPDTQISAAYDIDDDAKAIADLRQAAEWTGSVKAKRFLGMRLMQSRDAANQAEGRALLEQLAPNDPDAVSFLAGCFAQGCPAFRGDSGVADAWLVRAARLGDWWALTALIGKRQTSAHWADAWAWALYRLDLATAGCFESGEPSFVNIAQAARDAFRLERALADAQRTAGRAAAAAIVAQSWVQAATRLGCAG